MENFTDYIIEEEELEDIDYYEIVSLEEIIKNNPSFIAFSNEDIYNYLFNFFKSSAKTEHFLSLFNEVIIKQQQKPNINNFIIVTNAKRNNFSDLNIEEFIKKINDLNKEQIIFGAKNKNKLWFPLIYDLENTNIKFISEDKSLLELNNNDNFIIYKDDERQIPVLGVYFYEPITGINDYLNNKIVSHLYKNRTKGELLLSKDFKSIDDMILNYNINLPLDKIDKDEFYYENLNILFNKYNYDIDALKTNQYDELKSHLNNLIKEDKDSYEIEYKKLKITPFNLINNKFIFFDILKTTYKLLEITKNASKDLINKMEQLKKEIEYTNELPFLNNLHEIINNINNDNYENILETLRNIKKNTSINNIINTYDLITKNDLENINKFFRNVENNFKLLLSKYKDIYKISFTFIHDLHEIKLGHDIKDYEGAPLHIDEYKKNAVFVNDDNNEPNEINNEINNDNDDIDIKKYYNKSIYIIEKGFYETLTFISPFINTILLNISKKLKYDINKIIEHLFKLHRGIPEKYIIIKNNYNGKYDDSYYKEQLKKNESFILNNSSEDKELVKAINDYIKQSLHMIYDFICILSIQIQNEINNNDYYIRLNQEDELCINSWNNEGMPLNMEVKEKNGGVLIYIMCIFEHIFNELTEGESELNYLELDVDFKKIIINKLKTEDIYIKKINDFKKIAKNNKGVEAQKKLLGFIPTQDDKKNPKRLEELKQLQKSDKFLESFIEALLYMPSVKYEKIHKYLLGCCLEKIDSSFTADIYLKLSNRKDLLSIKEKLAKQRVLNKKRYLRFYILKNQKNLKKKYSNISQNEYIYDIYDNSLDEWFNNIEKNNTILSKNDILDIKTKLRITYNIHTDIYITNLFKKKSQIFKEFNFFNYKQILSSISNILYTNLKMAANDFIKQINNTIYELDNLSSIINDDNINDIYKIRTIIIIRCMCLPAYPEINENPKLISKIKITNMDDITNEIINKVLKLIENANMPTLEDQINYINKIREENKDKLIAALNRKSRDEQDVLKELKKIGVKVKNDNPDDDIPLNNDKEPDNDDDSYILGGEDIEIENSMDTYNYGFIYAQ